MKLVAALAVALLFTRYGLSVGSVGAVLIGGIFLVQCVGFFRALLRGF